LLGGQFEITTAQGKDEDEGLAFSEEANPAPGGSASN
jgi:hypothetical protein